MIQLLLIAKWVNDHAVFLLMGCTANFAAKQNSHVIRSLLVFVVYGGGGILFSFSSFLWSIVREQVLLRESY